MARPRTFDPSAATLRKRRERARKMLHRAFTSFAERVVGAVGKPYLTNPNGNVFDAIFYTALGMFQCTSSVITNTLLPNTGATAIAVDFSNGRCLLFNYKPTVDGVTVISSHTVSTAQEPRGDWLLGAVTVRSEEEVETTIMDGLLMVRRVSNFTRATLLEELYHWHNFHQGVDFPASSLFPFLLTARDGAASAFLIA